MDTNKNIVNFMKPRERESISDDYLNGLVSHVMSAVKEEKPIKIIPFYKKTIFWFSNVAALILIFILIQFNNQPTTIAVDFNSVSQKELLAYIEDNIEDFDQELLMSYLPVKNENLLIDQETKESESSSSEGSTNENKEESSFDKNQFNKISKEDILDYLDEEELNYEDLQDSPEIF